MPALLRRVKTRLAIHAHRRVRGMLDGEYGSVFHGRSIDFDDLRPYVAGDEPRDIDWKATARHGTPLIRRYIASRKHTVLMVVDTGRQMAALSAEGEIKSDLAIFAAGVMGYLAIRHGDRVALVAGDGEQTSFIPPGGTESHLEQLLQTIQLRTTLEAPTSDLADQLSYVSSAFRRRSIVFVVADDRDLTERETALLRRLAVQHELLWLSVGDADLMRDDWAGAGMRDVASGSALPEFLRSNPKLRAEFQAQTAVRADKRAALFRGLALSHGRVSSSENVVQGLFRLLELHRHARR
jgi:uncharacterized protein (DUF58 family)